MAPEKRGWDGGTDELEAVEAFVAEQERAPHALDETRGAAYWRANLRLMAILLTVWATVSYGFGILLVEPLNAIPFFGFKLGFWFAQQGAIYVFLVLIFVYVFAMHRLDARYAVDDADQDETVRTIGR